jgi:pimeloyl-ACP methyl ester carboxylesterase
MVAWGSGPTVLLLHGNPDSAMMWEGIGRRLADRFRCLAPDLPGFGHSEVPTDYERSRDGMARFVEQLRRAAEIEPPVDLIAHDFGGPFAFAWAIQYPSHVRRIVAINTSFFSDYRWHFWARVWRSPILGELAMAAMNRPMFARELRRGAGGFLPEEHIDKTWALITPRMKKEVLRLYRASDPLEHKGWEDRLVALTTTKPTLVIWGDKDPYISSRYAERFNARRVVHLPDIGHWPAVQAPAACAETILTFFSEHA